MINTVASECLAPDSFRIACFSDIVTYFSFLYVLSLCEPFSCCSIKGILSSELRFCNTNDFYTATLSFNQIRYCHFLKILHFSKIRWPSHDNGRPLVSMGSGSLFGEGGSSGGGEASGSQSFWSSGTSCTSGTSCVNDVSAVPSLTFKPLALPLTMLKEFAVPLRGLHLTSEFFWLSKVLILMNYHLNSFRQLCFLQ